MPRPNGPQFVRLFRGLANVTPEEVSKRSLGSHWTPDPNIAHNFATNRDVWGYPHDDDGEIPMTGTIVEALVHKRHIVDPNSEEGEEWASGANVLGPDSLEQERTVRDRGIVHIQAMHHVDDDADTYKQIRVKGRDARGRA